MEQRKPEYKCVARNINEMVIQLRRYIQSGHYFYIRCLIPEGKDREAIDQKMLERYQIARPRWRRERRNLKGSAGIHYIRYDNLFVIILSRGRHDRFYHDHGKNVQDVRRTALKVFGYSIRYTFSREEGKYKVFVRLKDEERRKIESHLLTICCWDAYRSSERLAGEIEGLPYAGFGPVFEQIRSLEKKVNRFRKRRGFEKVSVDFGHFVRRAIPRQAFVDDA